jgi:hypothetical protein
MAYVPSELRLIVGGFMSNLGGPNIWSLQGVDANTDVDTGTFITDAFARGMRRGDILFYTQWDNITTKATLTNITMHYVVTVAAGGGATLSNIASVTMTNTD